GNPPFPESLVAHLRAIYGKYFADTALATLLALFAAGLWIRSGGDGAAASRQTALAAGASLAATVAVLALTGIWPHHNQALYLPAILALAAAAPLVDRLSHVAFGS